MCVGGGGGGDNRPFIKESLMMVYIDELCAQ